MPVEPAADTAASTAGVARVSRVKWEYKSSNEKSRRGLRNYVANAVATLLPASLEPREGERSVYLARTGRTSRRRTAPWLQGGVTII